ncbi:hypothetical protein GCM10020219_082400 [Nonomuraea dietziae]
MAGRVIAGWDRGVAGMNGRRNGAKLVIRRTWATATRARGRAIKPGETLIFVVDLLGVR